MRGLCSFSIIRFEYSCSRTNSSAVSSGYGVIRIRPAKATHSCTLQGIMDVSATIICRTPPRKYIVHHWWRFVAAFQVATTVFLGSLFVVIERLREGFLGGITILTVSFLVLNRDQVGTGFTQVGNLHLFLSLCCVCQYCHRYRVFIGLLGHRWVWLIHGPSPLLRRITITQRSMTGLSWLLSHVLVSLD